MTTDITPLEKKAILEGHNQQFLQLLQACYIQKSKAPSMAIDTESAIQAVRSLTPEDSATLIDQLARQLPTERTLSPRDYSIIVFIQELFDAYCAQSPLHENIKQILACLRKTTAFYMLQHQQCPWLYNPNLKPTLQLIKYHCVGWSPELGRASSRFLTTLKSLLIDLSEARDTASFNQANRSLNEFFKAETKRISKLEKRLQEAEKGALHARHAQRKCARTLNHLMVGKKFPKQIIEFLHGPLQHSLQLLLINNVDEKQWKQYVELVETLIWSFQPIEDVEQQQHVYESIAILGEKLPDVLVSLHNAPHQLESQLSIIEEEHLKVLRKEPLSYTPFDLINNTDPLSHTQTVISSNLLKQVSALSEGQWFCFSEKGTPPIKLTLKLNEVRQLLFTNFFGIKAQVYSFEEFAYKLLSKAVVPIDKQDHYQSTGEKLICTLYDSYQNRKQQQAATFAEQQQRLKNQLKAQEAARAKALEEARQLAAAEQQKRLDAENRAKEAELERRKSVIEQSQQGKITTDISRLNIGGQVEFFNDSGDSRRLKLAVKLQSSEKYVFIDSTGVKREEKLKDDLVKMLSDGSAQIIHEGAYFEDSLEKVVNGLRKGRKK